MLALGKQTRAAAASLRVTLHSGGDAEIPTLCTFCSAERRETRSLHFAG